MSVKLLVSFLWLFFRVDSFNFNTNNYIVYLDPEKSQNSSSSYFGYSVVLYSGNFRKITDKWVKIGAPQGSLPQAKLRKTGLVYDCPYMKTCRPYLDLHTAENLIIPNQCPRQSFNNAWIGGTMDVSYQFNKLTVCGFRTVCSDRNNAGLVGLCFLLNTNNSPEQFPWELIPFWDNSKWISNVYLYGQGEAGFSAHFPKEENALLLGAPGVYNWAGTPIRVTEVESPIVSRSTSRTEILRRSKRNSEIVYDIPNISESFAHELFGYALNSGYFFGGKKIYYASSMPRAYIGRQYKGRQYTGKVIIFTFANKKKLQRKGSVEGTQFGEYFGAAIAAGDINNDGYDDLIVGAPYHVTDTYNEGRVYIFLGSKDRLKKYGTTLDGEWTNGQFGSAVMFLGDINNDTYGEVAIGAPYADGNSGILYIYQGNERGLENFPCQQIVGKNILPGIMGFGISISRPCDMDDNGFKDLLVGAHLSSNAVLLRSSPVVAIKYNMTTFPKQLQIDSMKFVLQACYSYTMYRETSVDIERTIIVDKLLNRFVLDGSNDKIVTLKRDGPICENVTIFRKNDTQFTMSNTSIKVSLSYKLFVQPQEKSVVIISDKFVNGSDNFDIRQPVLDERHSIHSSAIDVPYALDCGDDNVCQSDVKIETKLTNVERDNTFIVGMSDDIGLQAIVQNYGENAYSTQLEVVLPDIFGFKKISPQCQTSAPSILYCNMGNLLRNKSQRIELLLDIAKNIKENIYGSDINIRLRTLTTSKNMIPGRNVTLKLMREANITISGKSEQQSFLFGNIARGMPNFTQTYKVQNLGVSPVDNVTVEIDVPYAVRTSTYNVSFLHLTSIPEACKTIFNELEDNYTRRKREQVNLIQTISPKDSKLDAKDKEYEIIANRTYFFNCSMYSVVCSRIVCSIGPFSKQHREAALEIKMLFNTSKISGLLGTKDMVLISTNGSVLITSSQGFTQTSNRSHSASVSSLFINDMTKEPIALWIIIVSGLTGLLLLILVVFGFYKAGFFKRAKREELEHLKAEAAAEGELVEDDVVLNPPIHSSTEGLVDTE